MTMWLNNGTRDSPDWRETTIAEIVRLSAAGPLDVMSLAGDSGNRGVVRQSTTLAELRQLVEA